MISTVQSEQIVLNNTFPNRREVPPLLETSLLLKEYEPSTIDRTMVLFIDETYTLKIYDFTDHRTGHAELLIEYDLMPVFRQRFGNKKSSNTFYNTTEYDEMLGLSPQDIY